MKTIRFTMFLIYNDYKTGKWKEAPHLNMLISMAFLALINIVTIFCLFKRGNIFFDGSRWLVVLKFLVIVPILTTGFNLIGSKKTIEKLSFSSEKIRTGNILLLLYISISIILLILGIILHP